MPPSYQISPNIHIIVTQVATYKFLELETLFLVRSTDN